MKRNLIAAIAFILIATYIIPPYNIGFANEEENDCELMNFTVQTIKENDEKLEGKASVNQKFKIEFIRQADAEEITSDSNGKLEYKFEDNYLKENDKIIITNEHHKIETTVTAEEADSKTVESEQYLECVITEETVENAESENSNNVEEESSEKPAEKTVIENTEKEVKTEEQPGISSEETKIEEQLLESSEEDTSTENEKEKQVDASSEKDVFEEAEVENQLEESSEEDVATENETEKQADASSEEDVFEEAEAENQLEESSEDERKNSVFSDESKITAATIFNTSNAPLQPTEGKTVYVDSGLGLTTQLADQRVEVVIVTKDITVPISIWDIIVNSSSGQKILEVGNHSIDFRGRTLEIFSNVSNFVVRNASNLYTSSDNFGLFRKQREKVNLHLENVIFNTDNKSNSGKLGEHWRGSINFYGSNTINVNDTDNVMEFRKLIVHNNSTLNINYTGNGHALNFVEQSNEASKDYGIEVRENANLNINSNSGISRTNLSSQYDYHMKFQKGSSSIFRGNYANLLNSTQALDIYIDNVRGVDFINNNSNGRVFNSNQLNRFHIKNSSIHSWSNGIISGEPTSVSPIIKNGQFNFSDNNTVINNMTPAIPEFSSQYPPSVARLKFSNIGKHNMKISVEEINNSMTQIHGKTNPTATVEMINKKNDIIATTQADNNGQFIFVLDKPLESGTLLKFQSKLDYSRSAIIEEMVISSRWEIIDVPNSIVFKTTEIQDRETTIEREEPNMTVSVMDTRSKSDWHLTAKALTPLIDSEGNNSLDEVLYYIEGKSEQLIENNAVRVGEKDQSSDSNFQEISWGVGEGILLKLNPIQAQANTEYSTTIEWTLTDGP